MVPGVSVSYCLPQEKIYLDNGGNVWCYDFCYGETLAMQIIYMHAKSLTINAYRLLGMVVSKICVPPPVLVHF